jgi:hypothetical protein
MATRYAEGSSHPITNTFRCLTVKVCSVVEALGNVEARGKLCHGVSRNLSLLVFSSQLGLPTSISYQISQLNVSKEVPIYLVMTSGGIYLSFKLAQRAD